MQAMQDCSRRYVAGDSALHRRDEFPRAAKRPRDSRVVLSRTTTEPEFATAIVRFAALHFSGQKQLTSLALHPPCAGQAPKRSAPPLPPHRSPRTSPGLREVPSSPPHSAANAIGRPFASYLFFPRPLFAMVR